MSRVYGTEHILKDLNNKIKDSKPFSTIRYGDGCLGIVMSYKVPDIVRHGKWAKPSGFNKSNGIMRMLGIPEKDREGFVDLLIKYTNEADYIDSYDSFKTKEGGQRNLGPLASQQKQIHEAVGITNKSYCNPFLHYFSIVENEYNLFDLMRERKICIISNKVKIVPELREKSGARIIDRYQIPRRKARGDNHFNHYKNITEIIRKDSNNYDLFLIGAGFLGKIYCGMIKEYGGRAFDSGRLIDIWFGGRKIDSRPKRFIQINIEKMLCERVRESDDPVW